jgi:hypothetical protein
MVLIFLGPFVLSRLLSPLLLSIQSWFVYLFEFNGEFSDFFNNFFWNLATQKITIWWKITQILHATTSIQGMASLDEASHKIMYAYPN